MRHSAIPRCIHTPNLEFIPQKCGIYAQDTKRDGRMDGLTDGLTDSAITICLPYFLWGHKKGDFFCQKLPLPVALVAVLRQCSGSVVVHSLFIIASFVCGGGVWSLFCCAVFSALSRFVVISLRKRELLALLSNTF